MSEMGIEKVCAILALIWLISSSLLMMRMVAAGRALVNYFSGLYPEVYEEAGRPYPGYFHSVRGTRFAQFVGGREFEKLEDPLLVARFEAYRKSEIQKILVVLVSGGAIAFLAFIARYIT